MNRMSLPTKSGGRNWLCKPVYTLVTGVGFLLAAPALALAQEAEGVWTTDVAVDTLWVLIAGILVFFMNAGFGFVEAGFCRAKNAVNILAKNFVVFGISSIAFWAYRVDPDVRRWQQHSRSERAAAVRCGQ